eukprot:scaffold43487_cov204-Skeletonema_marinoi.AAC.6
MQQTVTPRHRPAIVGRHCSGHRHLQLRLRFDAAVEMIALISSLLEPPFATTVIDAVTMMMRRCYREVSSTNVY